MIEPLAPQDPPPPARPQEGYQSSEHNVSPDSVVPMGGNVPSQSVPAGQSLAQSAPFSALVGRALTSDETTWSMLSHLGGIVLGFLAPLIVMLTKGNESPYTKYHAVEALNFQITVIIGYVIASVLSVVLIGFFVFPVLIIVNLVFCIMAGIAANKGETYKYPVTLRLVK